MLPLALLLLAAWAFSTGAWGLGAIASTFFVFQAVWTLRRMEASCGGVPARPMRLPSRLSEKAVIVTGWMVALGALLVVLARSRVEPAFLVVIAVAFAVFAPIITIVVRRLTAWLRR